MIWISFKTIALIAIITFILGWDIGYTIGNKEKEKE